MTFVHATDGAPAREHASVAAYRTVDSIVFVFRAVDDDTVAAMRDRDAPLYKEDAVEVFLAPETLTEYYEFEINPLGTVFDARVQSPDGISKTMSVDAGWTCRDLFTAVHRERGVTETVIRIPFSSIAHAAPAKGDHWRANLFRIDRSTTRKVEFLAWSPSMQEPVDFHRANAFGTLVFE